MAVGRLNSPVKPMDSKLGSLILADFPTSINSLALRVIVPTGALSTTALYIPAAVRIVNHMMCSICHAFTPYALADSRWRSHRHRNNTALQQ